MDFEMIGQEAFSSWIIKEKIGEGGFGSVYKLEREEFNRKYESALKIISIPQSEAEIKTLVADGYDDEGIKEFYLDFVKDIIGEIDLMAKLKGTTNIVSYEDHKVVENTDSVGWTIYIRMEYLTPVFDYFKNNGISIRDIIKLGIDICSALEMCHKSNIVHRDIKPENIFVSHAGDFKLGDFGIARTLEKTSGGLSKKGTQQYMAPEIYRGEHYGTSVDIYSLGLVLYRFLNNNRMPFFSVNKKGITYHEREEALVKRMSGIVKIPEPLNGSIRLKEIVLKACSFNPNERYSSPTQMKEDLLAILYSEKDQNELLIEDSIDFHSSKVSSFFSNYTNSNDSNNTARGDDSFFCEDENTMSFLNINSEESEKTPSLFKNTKFKEAHVKNNNNPLKSDFEIEKEASSIEDFKLSSKDKELVESSATLNDISDNNANSMLDDLNQKEEDINTKNDKQPVLENNKSILNDVNHSAFDKKTLVIQNQQQTAVESTDNVLFNKPVKKNYSTSNTKKKSKMIIAIVVAVLLIVAVIAVCIGLSLKNKNVTNMTTELESVTESTTSQTTTEVKKQDTSVSQPKVTHTTTTQKPSYDTTSSTENYNNYTTQTVATQESTMQEPTTQESTTQEPTTQEPTSQYTTTIPATVEWTEDEA